MFVPTFFSSETSRISIKKEFDLPLILNDEKDIKIVFFGYSGCVDICTPRLYSISELYQTLDGKIKDRVGVEFIDISQPYDKTLPSSFAKYFNSDFKGIYLHSDVLYDYTKEFSVYFSKSLIDRSEFDHSTHLYIVKRTKGKKEIRYIYNSFPYDFERINLDIKLLLSE